MDNFTGDIGVLNKLLAKRGNNPFNQPLWRLVWSDWQVEKRRGIFRVHVGSLFLREEVGVREVPKYWNIKERWILERWFSGEQVYNPEIPESISGSYEPVWVFQDKHGSYLPPIEKAIDIIIRCAEYKTNDPLPTQEEMESKEVEHYMDALEVSPITNALHLKEAVGYTGEKHGRKQ